MVALDKNYSDITWKDGVGTYSYDSSRPHAMTATSGNGKVYKYDANGNIKQRGGNSIWWTAFNKTRSIFADNGAGYTFYYDANHSRVLETVVAGDLKSWNKFFVGGLYEEQHKDGKIEKRHFIPTPAGVIGVWSTSTDPHTPASRDYRVNDHLGSASVIVGEGGDIRDEYSYDSWGNPISVTNWSVGLSNWPSYLANRGFTGHEMLEEIELIHMNARIYDPVLGKFLSPDTYIQFEHNLQSYNRYSYVINNPLRYTDPSGKFVFSLAAMAYMATAEGLKWYMIAAISAAASMADALIQGATIGQALKAGAISAVAAVVTYKIGGWFEYAGGNPAEMGSVAKHLHKLDWSKEMIFAAKSVAHGVKAAGFAEVSGGNAGAGFASGFLGSYADVGIEQNFSGASGTLVAAAVGGTISEIGGGKFANGAITGAMQFALNQSKSSQKGDLDVYVEEKFANEKAYEVVDGKKVPLLDDDGNHMTHLEYLQKSVDAANAASKSFSYKIVVRTFKNEKDLLAGLKRRSKYALKSVSISHGDGGSDVAFGDGVRGDYKFRDVGVFHQKISPYGCTHYACVGGKTNYGSVIDKIVNDYAMAYGTKKR